MKPEAETFSVIDNFSQLVDLHTRAPARHGDRAHILDLILATIPSPLFNITSATLLGSPRHCLIKFYTFLVAFQYSTLEASFGGTTLRLEWSS